MGFIDHVSPKFPRVRCTPCTPWVDTISCGFPQYHLSREGHLCLVALRPRGLVGKDRSHCGALCGADFVGRNTPDFALVAEPLAPGSGFGDKIIYTISSSSPTTCPSLSAVLLLLALYGPLRALALCRPYNRILALCRPLISLALCRPSSGFGPLQALATWFSARRPLHWFRPCAGLHCCARS